MERTSTRVRSAQAAFVDGVRRTGSSCATRNSEAVSAALAVASVEQRDISSNPSHRERREQKRDRAQQSKHPIEQSVAIEVHRRCRDGCREQEPERDPGPYFRALELIGRLVAQPDPAKPDRGRPHVRIRRHYAMRDGIDSLGTSPLVQSRQRLQGSPMRSLACGSEKSGNDGTEKDGRKDVAFNLNARLQGGKRTPPHSEEERPHEESQPGGLQDQPNAHNWPAG
jgi:hypothetical protein